MQLVTFGSRIIPFQTILTLAEATVNTNNMTTFRNKNQLLDMNNKDSLPPQKIAET